MTDQSRALIETVQGELVDGDAPTVLEAAGRAANAAAAGATFTEYRELKSANTRRAQDAALALFARFLGEAGVSVDTDELTTTPRAWRGVTVGLVKAFKNWQRGEGYAVNTINARLAHVRTCARLATEAGAIPPGEAVRIQGVKSYDARESIRVDERREAQGTPTRVSTKKSEPVTVTEEQADKLMAGQPDTAQGRRDAVLATLVLKHGLRVSEVAILNVAGVTLTRDDDASQSVGC